MSATFTRIWRYPSAKVALVILAVVALLTALGPLLAPQDPLAQHTEAMLHGPSAQYWLGTDNLGRDVFSRLLAGSTLSVLAALQSVLIALVLGVVPGLLSVYLGRTFEWFTLRFVDALITLPFLVFAIAMTALLGNGLVQAMFAVGILITPAFFRVSRAAALSAYNAQYVEAAVLMGASTRWVILRHVLLKVIPAVAVTTASMTGACLAIVASLTFLGIGVVPPEPTWGGLLATDLKNLYDRPYGPLVPAVMIIATVWALNALADVMRDVSGKRAPEPAPRRGQPQARVADAVAGPAPDIAGPGALLSVRNLQISLAEGKALVHDVSFDLRAGGTLGIVGESGSGKSLTCHALLGILPAGLTVTGGSALYRGADLTRLPRRDWKPLRGTRISAVFQDPASYLNPSIPVGRQLAEALRSTLKLSRVDARARGLDLLRKMGLHNVETVYQQYPFELSGGMLQRVLIAIAVCAEPELLIADEATTALDVTVQAEVLDLLATLRRELKLALILVSHDLAVVTQVCDQVIVMRHGVIIEAGPTAQVLADPKHPYTRSLVVNHQEYGLEKFLAPETEDA